MTYVLESLESLLDDEADAGLRRAFEEWVRLVAERAAPGGADKIRVGTLKELRMSLMERAARWGDKWREEGREQGIEQGIEQGLAHERALLQRQVALRFGAEVASRVAQTVDGIDEPERLALAAEWIVRARTGDELVAQLAHLGTRGSS